MTVTMLALLILQNVPDKPVLKAGDRADYARSMKVVLEIEGTVPGKDPIKGGHEISMEADYGFAVEGLDDGLQFVMTIPRMKLGQVGTGPKARSDSWSLPEGRTLETRVCCDERGRLRETGWFLENIKDLKNIKMPPNLRTACEEAGCDSRLGKIPLVYFWSGPMELKGAKGPFASGPMLPATPSREWTFSSEHSYGPGGLLDDFTLFEEVWKAVLKKADAGMLECDLMLVDVKILKAHRKQSLEIREKEGRGSWRIDAASGLTLSCEMEHSFSFTGKVGKAADVKGTIRRTEKVAKR